MTDYAIITLDTKSFVTTWNKGAEKLKAYRREEIIGQHVSIVYPPEKVSSRFVDYELKMAVRGTGAAVKTTHQSGQTRSPPHYRANLDT